MKHIRNTSIHSVAHCGVFIVTAGVTYLNHLNLNGCLVALYAKLLMYSNHRAVNGIALHVPLQTIGQCAFGSLFLNTKRKDGDLCCITHIRLVLQFMLNQEISGYV